MTVDATDTVTGSFTYNTATKALSNIDVILSGASVYSGTYAYQFTQSTSLSPAELGFSAARTDNGDGDPLYFGFGGALGSSSLTLGGFAAYNGPLGNEFAAA